MNLVRCSLLAILLPLVACGPQEKQMAQFAEEKRIHCLDHRCEGDVEPKHNTVKEVALKLNGEWFIGPKEYFSTGTNGAAFYWPSKTPSAPGDRDFPERELVTAGRGEQVTIEIFLRHHDGVFKGQSRHERLKQSETQGRVNRKEVLRDGLEVWHTKETDGFGPGLWFVATNFVKTHPNGAVLSCRDNDPKFARCVTGFEWRPGIAADTRFQARHSADWPDIYQEIVRVLQQLRKA